jgi:choline transport protein
MSGDENRKGGVKEEVQKVELHESGRHASSRDDEVLARLGKKPVLKRNFGFLTILGFSCTVLITWEGSLM